MNCDNLNYTSALDKMSGVEQILAEIEEKEEKKEQEERAPYNRTTFEPCTTPKHMNRYQMFLNLQQRLVLAIQIEDFGELPDLIKQAYKHHPLEFEDLICTAEQLLKANTIKKEKA